MGAQIHRNVRDTIKALDVRGVEARFEGRTAGGHVRLLVHLPTGEARSLICGSTPSDHRSIKNAVAIAVRWTRENAVNDGIY